MSFEFDIRTELKTALAAALPDIKISEFWLQGQTHEEWFELLKQDSQANCIAIFLQSFGGLDQGAPAKAAGTVFSFGVWYFFEYHPTPQNATTFGTVVTQINETLNKITLTTKGANPIGFQMTGTERIKMDKRIVQVCQGQFNVQTWKFK